LDLSPFFVVDQVYSMEQPNREATEIATVTITDVDAAHTEAARAKAQLDDAEDRFSGIVGRQRHLKRRLNRYKLTRRARELFDNWTTRHGGLFITIFGPCLMVLVVCHALGLPFFLWAILFLAVFTTASFAGTQLFTPNDEQLAALADALSKEDVSVVIQKAQAATRVSQAKSLFDQCLLKYQGAFGHFQRRLDRLRATDWASLEAIPLADFLAEVLGARGYDVSTPTRAASADPAVELIVSKSGFRTAIHVKGHPDSRVGNDAVQHARTSETLHSCDGCAVITNSTFTPSARRAAQELECLLIDQEQIPLLIEGKVRI
jgi:hypothetical protein